MSYEIRKWVIKPLLKEVISRKDTLEEVKSFIHDLMVRTGMSLEEISENFEIEDMENGILTIKEV